MSAFVPDDGGRAEAGFKGKAGDCVCRAIAIATGQPYRTVFDDLSALGWFPGGGMKRDPDGLYRPRPDNEYKLTREYLAALGWTWTPTMRIGSGCKVHLRADELPAGRLIVSVSGHMVAVIDGVIHDTYDCSRDGTRCVYGYFEAPTANPNKQTEDTMNLLEKSATLLRGGGSSVPPAQLEAFDLDGKISKELMRYGDPADRVQVRDRAERALAAAVSVDGVKAIHDLAIGMLAYARKANDHELEADAAEIRMKATRRLGEMMKAQKETVGLNRGAAVPTRVDDKPTLASQGIDKNLAQAARTAAAMPAPDFEQAVADRREAVGTNKRKPKPRSELSKENAIDRAEDDVSRIVLRTLHVLDSKQHRRLASRLHHVVDELVENERHGPKTKAKVVAKPKRSTKPKPKPKRRPMVPRPDANRDAIHATLPTAEGTP